MVLVTSLMKLKESISLKGEEDIRMGTSFLGFFLACFTNVIYLTENGVKNFLVTNSHLM